MEARRTAPGFSSFGPGAYRVFDASLHADFIERLRFERDPAGAVRSAAGRMDPPGAGGILLN